MPRRPLNKPNDFIKTTADLTPLTKGAKVKRDLQIGKGKATKAQWQWVDTCIKAFMNKYPTEMVAFMQDLELNRTKYQDVLPMHGKNELKKANWRNTASFPIIMERNEQGELVEIDSLLPMLKQFIPDITDFNSPNFDEFMRRYPMFRPGQKI